MRAGSPPWLAATLNGTEPSLTKLASPVLLKSAVTSVRLLLAHRQGSLERSLMSLATPVAKSHIVCRGERSPCMSPWSHSKQTSAGEVQRAVYFLHSGTFLIKTTEKGNEIETDTVVS